MKINYVWWARTRQNLKNLQQGMNFIMNAAICFVIFINTKWFCTMNEKSVDSDDNVKVWTIIHNKDICMFITVHDDEEPVQQC